MASNKPRGKKIRLVKAGRRRRWAPFWVIPKVFGSGRRMHPSIITRIKRNWKRTKIKA